MLLTVENTCGVGKPVVLSDASGALIEHCYQIDTDTGRAECYVVNDDGNYIPGREDGNAVAKTVYFDTPIRVEWIDGARAD